MGKSTLVGGLVMAGMALAGIIEAIHLINNKDPHTFDEMVGPGAFILILAIPLMITSLFFIFMEYRKKSKDVTSKFGQPIDTKLVGIFLVTALYIYLIGIIGYMFSSFIFFVIAFKLSGVNNWKMVCLISIVLSILYYGIFVEFASLSFPKAVFFTGY